MPSASAGLLSLIVLGLACAALSLAANGLLIPVFRRYALARPNARSSHKTPTPQGGGVGVLIALVLGLMAFSAFAEGAELRSWPYAVLLACALLLAATGALDDIYTLAVRPRLAAQMAAAAAGLIALMAMDGGVPRWLLALAFPVLLLALVWFVNLTNFMDGIDGITVAEFVPISGALVLLSYLGALTLADSAVAAALGGALLGFWPYNRPVARLFLGDVGSLSIGFIAGCLLIRLALSGFVVAALILPLYYFVDATLTLGIRFLNGETVTEAHRSHFYQRASDFGWSVPAITTLIWQANLTLGGLAVLSLTPHLAISMLALVAAVADVCWVLSKLSNAPAS